MTNNVLNYTEQTGTADNKKVFGGSVENLDTAIVIDNATHYGNDVQSLLFTATQTEINAGKVVLADVADKTITILGYDGKVSGNFATGTSVEIEDTNGTPVVIASIVQAGLTDGAILTPAETNTTMGVGYLGTLTAGKGIAITKTGSDFTAGTSITIRLFYKIA